MNEALHASTDPVAIEVARLFAAGNYTGVLLQERPDLWQTPASLALIGRVDDALDGLDRFRTPEARFHEAVAHWMRGDETTATAILERLSGEHARRLLVLIRRPRLRVLSLLPSPGGGPHVLLRGAAADGKFELTNIGYAADDAPNHPEADVRGFHEAANPPDFLICAMVEWHQIPPNLRDLPCPLLGHTADFDLHCHPVLPWLRMFDEILVTDHTEHADASRLVSAPVSTFPKVFGHPFGLPLPRRRTRDIDLFLSGTLFAPAHPDKAVLLHDLLGLEALGLVGFNGFLAEAAYYDLLSRAKIGVAYCRHSGAMVTRGIEAASMGCVTLVQEGSALPLAVGDGHDFIPYPAEPGGIVRTLRRVLERYDEHERRAWQGAWVVRRALAPELTASQYLRFCTVLATRPRPPRQAGAAPPPVQRRVAFWKGWRPGGGAPAAAAALCRSNVARLRAELEATPSAATVDAMARELLLEAAARLIQDAPPVDDPDDTPPRRIARALALYRAWLPHFPAALAARFNYLRAAAHFGSVTDIGHAWSLLERTLAGGPDRWRLERFDDLFPYDWGETLFDHRAAVDLAVSGTDDDAVSAGLAALIEGAAHHYRARLTGDLPAARRAAALVPAFAWYSLDLAKRLAAGGDSAGKTEAVSLLSPLCRTSAVAVQAYYVLARLAADGVPVPDLAAMAARAARIEANLLDAENPDARRHSAYHAAQVLHSGGRRGVLIRDRRPPGAAARLSVIFADPACHRATAILDGLDRQDRPERESGGGMEVIAADPYDAIPDAVAGRLDVAIACGQLDVVPHVGRAANAALLAATGDVVLLLAGPPPADPRFLASVLAAFPPSAGKAPPLVHRDGAGQVLAIAALRADLLALAGFDEHEALARASDAFGALAARIARGGPSAEPVWQPDATRRALWPTLADGQSRPFRENRELARRHERLLLEAEGMDILDRLRTAPFAQRRNDGVYIGPEAPVGHALYGPYMTLPAGTYALEFRVRATDHTAEPILAVEAVATTGPTLASATFGAAGLSDIAILEFMVPPGLSADRGHRVPLEFRFSHLAAAAWALLDARIRLRSEVEAAG